MFLAVTALSTLVLTFLSSAVSTTALVAFIPYQLWLVVAASLSIGYWRLNR
jgi:tryptophan-rich sensory protein